MRFDEAAAGTHAPTSAAGIQMIRDGRDWRADLEGRGRAGASGKPATHPADESDISTR
jgi:hypothetical protein